MDYGEYLTIVLLYNTHFFKHIRIKFHLLYVDCCTHIHSRKKNKHKKVYTIFIHINTLYLGPTTIKYRKEHNTCV